MNMTMPFFLGLSLFPTSCTTGSPYPRSYFRCSNKSFSSLRKQVREACA